MKTTITTYCTDYEKVLRPFTTALEGSLACLEKESAGDTLKVTQAKLNDIHHRLKTLIDKIEGQQTYLLIFGPLKSGKSTLMNAVSGAYVSEVTSLPAYPCLVYVGYNQQRSFRVTRYNGKTMDFTDNSALQTVINDSHNSLADRILDYEKDGVEFDPGVHYAEAIRRVDVRLPVASLHESSTVLVDTPGLYSRMKFGYDLMTRVFRDSAACAVFVVKTDNLFLEQVFAEFNQLLDLFSRIFLVVNIDSSKKDLRPDGSLQPSMESQDPMRIIAAFESLSMSAPLRKAFDDGRLRIYPIDILTAAQNCLQANNRPESSAAESDAIDAAPDGDESQDDSPVMSKFVGDIEEQEDFESETGEESQEESVESEGFLAPIARRDGAEGLSRVRVTFDDFMSDLTEYLNSNDYLVEFMRDSLRQGLHLSEEIGIHCDPDQLVDFEIQRRDLEQELERVKEQIKAIQELGNVDLQAAFEPVAEEIRNEIENSSAMERNRVAAAMTKSLDQWFETRESLADLQSKHWNPILKNFSSNLTNEINSRVQTLVEKPHCGGNLSPGALQCLDMLDLSLTSIHHSVMSSMTSSLPEPASIQVDSNLIPVRRTFLDWILFRNQIYIRHRLFGGPSDPSQNITPGIKQKRLSGDGKAVLANLVESRLKSIFPNYVRQCSQRQFEDYTSLFSDRVSKRLTQMQEELSDQERGLDRKLAAQNRIREAFDGLDRTSVEVTTSIRSLMEIYGGQEEEAAIEALEEPAVEIERSVAPGFAAGTSLDSNGDEASLAGDDEELASGVDALDEDDSEEALDLEESVDSPSSKQTKVNG